VTAIFTTGKTSYVLRRQHPNKRNSQPLSYMCEIYKAIHLVRYTVQHRDQYAGEICRFLRQLAELNQDEFGNWYELQVSYAFTGYKYISLCEEQFRKSIYNKLQRNPAAEAMTLIYYAGNHPKAVTFIFHFSISPRRKDQKKRNIITIGFPGNHPFFGQPDKSKEVCLLLSRFWESDHIYFCNEFC
jgi:hypothetical protein